MSNHTNSTVPVTDLQRYLQRYGYLREGYEIGREDDYTKEAIASFQKRHGLEVSATFDFDTRNFMDRPRCGNPDVLNLLMEQSLHDFHLTYRFQNFSGDLTQKEIRDTIETGFKSWSEVIPLTFQRVTTDSANIDIGFYVKTHGRAGHEPFDGPGKVLAHALTGFLPGYIHFDEDETWGTSGSSNTDLQAVALHEIGHAIGLSHSKDRQAVMYNYFSAGRIALAQDDLNRIRDLYGRLYIIKGNVLYRLDPHDFNYHRTEQGWINVSHATALGVRLYFIRDNMLYRVDPGDFRVTGINKGWDNVKGIVGLSDRLYILNGDTLHRMNPANFEITGTNTGWGNVTAITALQDRLYLIQGDYLKRMRPEDFQVTGQDSGFQDCTLMEGLGERIFIIRNGTLYRINPSNFEVTGTVDGLAGSTHIAGVGERLYIICDGTLLRIDPSIFVVTGKNENWSGVHLMTSLPRGFDK